MSLKHDYTRQEYRAEQIKEARALARQKMLEQGCDWERYWSPLIWGALQPAFYGLEI